MVDVKPGPHAEHVNPMPHNGIDVAYHIPILDNPAKEPTHAVSPCAIATPIEMTSAVLLRTLRILLLPLSSHRDSALFVLPLGSEQTVVGLLFDGANARW